MTKAELIIKLRDNNVPERLYSLDDGLKPDSLILYKNYYKWEFFYLDEKGNRNMYCEFKNEEEAFDYFWSKIEYEVNFRRNILGQSYNK